MNFTDLAYHIDEGTDVVVNGKVETTHGNTAHVSVNVNYLDLVAFVQDKYKMDSRTATEYVMGDNATAADLQEWIDYAFGEVLQPSF